MTAPAHPAAELFPMLDEASLEELTEDIRQNGLLNPIVLHEGRVLDGRNRLLACERAGVSVQTVPWIDPGCGPTAWVISQNLHRRHLTASQRAVVALDALPLFEAEARKRQAAAGASAAPGRPAKKDTEEIPEVSEGESREQAASQFGVNPHYISDAKKIAEEAPDLLGSIREGSLTITQAQRQIKERKRESRRQENREKVAAADVRSAPVDARFATIVIDPPWDWGDEGDVDQMGRARPTYETMSIEQLRALPFDRWADEDCHLYLWITNRSLPKGFALMESWGFRYVTALTWCKPHYGMGNYFRGSTEHVLFGVKGSQPLKRKNVGTWFEARRGPGGHSSKPTEFYELVESCSPGPYAEVFARSERPEWFALGAEVSA